MEKRFSPNGSLIITYRQTAILNFRLFGLIYLRRYIYTGMPAATYEATEAAASVRISASTASVRKNVN